MTSDTLPGSPFLPGGCREHDTDGPDFDEREERRREWIEEQRQYIASIHATPGFKPDSSEDVDPDPLPVNEMELPSWLRSAPTITERK